MKRLFLFLVALAIISCASSKKAVNADDLLRVEIKANEALNLAKADSLRIASISRSLNSISKRVNLLDSIFSVMPVAKVDESQLQIALLREEVAFLRRFLENQNQVPLINPSRKQTPEIPVQSSLPAEYEQAQYLFSQKDYGNAAKAFEKVTVLYPKSDWAADAWYWSGESQMALGNYAQAFSAFEKVFFYTGSIKHADAQFQIGVCLSKVGNAEAAKAAFRKVQEFYPKSPRALQARAELNKLK